MKIKLESKKGKKKHFNTTTTPNELNIEELMYRGKEWSCITAAKV